VISDELLWAYTKAEDEAMNTAFSARGKRRLKRVFDVIGFIYPDYCFPIQKQGMKRKIATSTSSSGPKPKKKVKVLTRRPKLHSLEKTAAAPTSEKMEIEYAKATISPIKEIEAKNSNTEERTKLQSPPTMTGLPKLTTATSMTPRKGGKWLVFWMRFWNLRMCQLLFLLKFQRKILKKLVVTAANASPTCIEAGSSRFKPAEQEKEDLPENSTSPTPEASSQDDLEYIVHHASWKQLSEEQIVKVQHYAKDLKYPRGSLVCGGNDEDDFLYCLSDNKEINVCREMMDNCNTQKCMKWEYSWSPYFVCHIFIIIGACL
jgi:hypothetical protein